MIKPEQLDGVKKELTGICLFVTSTFGNGDPPRTGEALAEWIDVQQTKMEAFQHRRMASTSTTDYDTLTLDDPENVSGPSKSLYRRMAMAKKKILGDLRSVFGIRHCMCQLLANKLVMGIVMREKFKFL